MASISSVVAGHVGAPVPSALLGAEVDNFFFQFVPGPWVPTAHIDTCASSYPLLWEMIHSL